MKFFIVLATLMLSVNVFATVGNLKIVLDTPEIEKLDIDMREKGFHLSKIEDVHAQAGVFPRCMCEKSLTLTFTKVKSGKAENKVFSVFTRGPGTSLQVSITPAKK